MQAAKQIRLSRNARRSEAFSSRSRWSIESIQRKQKSAFSRIDGMCSTAANARSRSSGSGR
jgi:hypothetical protein